MNARVASNDDNDEKILRADGFMVAPSPDECVVIN